MRLGRGDSDGTSGCVSHEADVQVQVFWLTGASRDDVDVEVDGLGVDQYVDDATFFDDLAPGNGNEVGLTVGVAAELEPAVELAVVGEQDVLAGRVEHQSRRGEVPRSTAAAVGVARVGGQERQHLGADVGLLCVRR